MAVIGKKTYDVYEDYTSVMNLIGFLWRLKCLKGINFSITDKTPLDFTILGRFDVTPIEPRDRIVDIEVWTK